MGVLVAMISLILVGVLTTLQDNLGISFGKISAALEASNAKN